ncbi:MAG: helix-turn-helix transcriptional regulator [Oscillospiraceae bacterium]|nr:helix-turn-helix transcriptional regulator [Oscillospiraceae bacterium]
MARRKIDLSAPAEAKVVNAATGAPIEKNALPLICERIRFYREKRGLEQKVFAGLIGVTANAASNWERGRSRPDVNLLPAICRALEITLYDLYGEKMPVDRMDEREKKLIEGYRALNAGNRYAVDKTVETLGLVQRAGNRPGIRELLYFERSLAAGFGDPTEFEQEAEPIWLYASPEVDRADYVFSVNGDSMEPEFRSGDLVLVQKLSGSSSLRFGEIGAFIVGNETYIKEYREDGLHSLNQNYEVLRFADEEPVYLIGRVLGIASPEEIAGEEDIEAFLTIHGAAG